MESLDASSNVDQEKSREPTRPVVLLLDDEPSVLQSLSRYLEVSGYDVVTVSDVDGACRTLTHSSIDAAILDVRLPGRRSGLEVLEFVRLDDGSRKMPVIVLTGVELAPDEEDIVRRHAAYVFYKPHGYSDIVRYLTRLLRRS
jgi:DNA-binding response OmpR family regulator